MCAEVLLSGVLAINNKSMDLSHNGVLYKHPILSYAIPDKYNIEQYKCSKEHLQYKKISKMRNFIRKID